IEEPCFDSDRNFYTIKKDSEERNLWVVEINISKDILHENRISMIQSLLASMFFENDIKNYIFWYYSPMALEYSHQLTPDLIIYDCMDELSAFKFAPPELKQKE